MSVTADFGSGSERTGVGFWARSYKEQAFVINDFYNNGNQQVMVLGIYNAAIPIVYVMNM